MLPHARFPRARRHLSASRTARRVCSSASLRASAISACFAASAAALAAAIWESACAQQSQGRSSDVAARRAYTHPRIGGLHALLHGCAGTLRGAPELRLDSGYRGTLMDTHSPCQGPALLPPRCVRTIRTFSSNTFRTDASRSDKACTVQRQLLVRPRPHRIRAHATHVPGALSDQVPPCVVPPALLVRPRAAYQPSQ